MNLREAAQQALNEFDDLVSESRGVYGLHLNGDVAPWGEVLAGGRFERLEAFEALRAALEGPEHDEVCCMDYANCLRPCTQKGQWQAGQKALLEAPKVEPLTADEIDEIWSDLHASINRVIPTITDRDILAFARAIEKRVTESVPCDSVHCA